MTESVTNVKKADFFKKIRNNRVIRPINRFLHSPYFLILLAIYSVITNVFALELYTYSIIVFIAVYVAVFSSDFLPIMPMFVFSYLSPSGGNNPAKNSVSIFSFSGYGKYFIAIVSLFFAVLLVRLIFDKKIGFRAIRKKKFALVKGIALVCASFLLSGIFSEGYAQVAKRNLIFVAIELASLFLLYFLFSFTVKWKRVKADYFCILATLSAVVVVLELANIYRIGNIVTDGVIAKYKISTGWGTCNNIGAMLAMTLCCIFFFAQNRKWGFVLLPLAEITLIATFFTLSRASMLFACVAFLTGCVAICVKKEYFLRNFLTLIVIIGILAVFCAVYKGRITTLFSWLFEKGIDDSGRFSIYKKAMQRFFKAPVFGHSFYLPDYGNRAWQNKQLSAVLPPLMHNTIIQVLASCGTVGIVAYLFHRVETVIIVIKDFSAEKFFVALSVAGLLFMSLLDCHLFNLGPGLYYATALVFMENVKKRKVVRKKKVSEAVETGDTVETDETTERDETTETGEATEKIEIN